MSSTSANMSLTVWDADNDRYDHDELAGNFNTIDAHDHTSGEGVQIPTGGIADDAVTEAKIADESVTADKLAPGAVGEAQLDTSFVHPVGSTILWWRPSGATPIPDGWVHLEGQTLLAAQHDFPGGGSVVLPDTRNAFPLGADTDGTGSGVATPPAIGGTGGAQTKNLTHSHAVNAHTHAVAGHSHTVNSHHHTVSNHDHGPGTYDTDKATIRDVKLKTDNDSNHRANTVTSGGDDGHKHQVTGRSGSESPNTDSKSPGTSSVSLTTDSGTATTDSQLSGSFDIRPKYVGFLFLMKVKNS